MSRPNELLDRARGYTRIWAEFIRAYQKDPTRLYCFFEGTDDPRYYNPRIQSIVFQNKDEHLSNFWCQGKQNIIRVFGLLSNDARYEKAWVAFFIDKDFDDIQDLPNDNRLFITPCYAVENLYVSQRVVERILRDEFAISESDDDFQPSVDLFKSMLDRFNEVMEELNAWLYLQRRNEKVSGNQSKVYINNLNNDNLFTIRLDEVIKKYTLQDLIEAFSDAPIIPPAEISRQIATFRQTERTLTFRGKYLLFFQRSFLMCLKEDRGKRKNRQHFTSRGRVQLQLSANIISELSQYADTPESLREFLTKRADAHDKQLGFEL